MPDNQEAFIDAVKSAMKSEQEAVAFYKKAARETQNPKGRDMFTQLVSFEEAHYAALARLLDSLDSGGFTSYEGTSFSTDETLVVSQNITPQQHQTDIDALSVAIEAEEKARAKYLDLAESATEKKVAAFFTKLAAEEELHRRVLDDQFFALSNKGHWTWGD